MLVTLHSETKEPLEYNIEMAQNLYKAMKTQNNTHFIITKANSDFGGAQINSFWDSNNEDKNISVITSLGQKRYLSIMKQVECVIGNSSSGIVEAPFLWIPLINICKRKKVIHIDNYDVINNDDIFINNKSINIDEKLDLYNAVDLLKNNYKTIIIMKYFNDLTIKEIGYTLNLSENTVKTNLKRAKEALFKILKEGYLND